MLTAIAPTDVVVVDRRHDEGQLYPQEAALVAHAVASRRLEFTTVRHCARLALRGLGAPAVALVPGESGRPGWPPGVTGSMTHCSGYRAAAVAHARDYAGLGIDAEPHAALPAEVLPMVTRPEERRWMADSDPSVHWGRVVFSIKEAIYKAWNPVTHRWLDFHDALVHCSADGRFTADLLVPVVGPVSPRRVDGRWTVVGGLVLSLATIAHPTEPPGPRS